MPPETDAFLRPLLAALQTWLAAGGCRIGEVIVLHGTGGGYKLRHVADARLEGLPGHTRPEAAREVAKYDAAGEFRPLKTAPTLIRGWEISLANLPDLLLALDFLYPAALANWVRCLEGEAVALPLPETLARQTGIYRVTGLLRDDEARQLVAGTCAGKCLRHVLWPPRAGQTWSSLTPEKQSMPPGAPATGDPIPLLCLDPCPLLVGGARSVVKRRLKKDREESQI